MSEQVRKQTTEQANAGRTDLSDLSASKDLHKRSGMEPSNSTDLASVSISSSSFVRATSQAGSSPERARQHMASERSLSTATKVQGGAAKSSAAAPGLFKNPTYPYRGGLASKILTFLANLLKVLERLFLRLLGARELVTPAPRHQPAQPLKTERKEPREGEQDKSEREARVIHRS